MKLRESMEALCIATRADGRSPRTVQSYRQKLKPLIAFLGNVDVTTITVHDLRRYVVALRDQSTLYADHPTKKEEEGHLSPFTIQSRVRHMKRLFNWLYEEKVIEDNPVERIRTPNPRVRTPKGISEKDFLALLETASSNSVIDCRDRAIMFFLADTGCRVGGLCRLRVEDVNLGDRLAELTEKGSKTRLVPFTKTTVKAIRDWLEVRPTGKGSWLFVGLGNRAEDGVTPNSVATMLGRRAEQARAEGPTNPHSFRHAFARSFLLHGGDLGTLSDLLGHENVLVTKRYYGVFKIKELQGKHQRHSPIAQMFEGDNDVNET